MHYIAVIGPSDASVEECRQGREVGRLLGERGIVVLTGGLGGVMAAAAKGCLIAGGTAIGLLPDEDRRRASEHLSLSLPTGLGELRNGLLMRSADGAIAVGGSWGTLSEIALAMRSNLPLVCVSGWSVLDQDGGAVPLMTATSPRRAVDLVLDLVDSARRTGTSQPPP